jgi:hypothetical protein
VIEASARAKFRGDANEQCDLDCPLHLADHPVTPATLTVPFPGTGITASVAPIVVIITPVRARTIDRYRFPDALHGPHPYRTGLEPPRRHLNAMHRSPSGTEPGGRIIVMAVAFATAPNCPRAADGLAK